MTCLIGLHYKGNYDTNDRVWLQVVEHSGGKHRFAFNIRSETRMGSERVRQLMRELRVLIDSPIDIEQGG